MAYILRSSYGIYTESFIWHIYIYIYTETLIWHILLVDVGFTHTWLIFIPGKSNHTARKDDVIQLQRLQNKCLKHVQALTPTQY